MKKKNIKIPKGFPKLGEFLQVTYYPLGFQNKKKDKPMRGTLVEWKPDAIKIKRDTYRPETPRGCWFPLDKTKIRRIKAPRLT